MDAPVPSDSSVFDINPAPLPWEISWEPPPVDVDHVVDRVDPEYGEYHDLGAHEWRA